MHFGQLDFIKRYTIQSQSKIMKLPIVNPKNYAIKLNIYNENLA